MGCERSLFCSLNFVAHFLFQMLQWKEKSHDSLPPGGGGRLISLRSKTTEIKSRHDAGSADLRATQVDPSGSVRSLNGSTRGAKRQRSPDSRLQSERIVSEKQKVYPFV